MSAVETVRTFLDAWGVPGGWKTALPRWLTADCVWENVGLSKTVGPAEASAFVEAFAGQLPFEAMAVENLRILADGNVVVTERIDRFYDAGGKLLLSIPVMGVFELRGDRICLWRDYADLSSFKN